MDRSKAKKVIFTDIGGVLLTNGWDHSTRLQAARVFGLDYSEINERHHLTFDTYEEGKLSLKEYLQRVIFYEPRSFSMPEFRDYMFEQSKAYPEMFQLISELKSVYSLKIVAISNEGRELTDHRIQKFRLDKLIDLFISSCFVHFRKPDLDIYRIAMDIAQAKAKDAIYIEDRPMFADIASEMGIQSIVHTSVGETRQELAKLGLSV